MEFDFYAIVLLIAFLTSTVQCHDFLEMSQISRDLEDILRTVNSTTMTSCHMICSREMKCNAIGLTKGSDKGPLYNCHLLKKKVDVKDKAETKNELKMIKLAKLNDPKTKPDSGSDSDTKWKRYTFVGCNERPIVNREIMTIEKRTLQYRIHIEVMRTKVETKMGFILYLLSKGQYIPFITFSAGNHGLTIGNGNPYKSCSSDVVQPLNKWIDIDVSQTKEGDDYIYSVSVDGESIYRDKNIEPIEYQDVKVVLGSSTFPQAGFVRNCWMMVEK